MNISEQVSVETSSSLNQESAQYFRTMLGTIGTTRTFGAGAVVFMQGDSAGDLMYLLEGAVTKSVMSRDGKEGVVGLLGPGDFLGEECLTGQTQRMATVATLSAGRSGDRQAPDAVARRAAGAGALVLTRTLARLNRIEDDLPSTTNPSEKRLARTLLCWPRYGATTVVRACCPTSRRRCSPRWSGRRGRA